MHALRDGEGAVAGMFAAAVWKRMAGFDPFHGRRQIRMQVRPDHERLTNLQVADGEKRCGHGRRRFADGDHVHGRVVDQLLHAQSQRAIDHTTCANRVDTGAENVLEIGLELSERKRQWT